ncbi:DEAD/DEAH box helicase [Leptospira mayottensis]|nr:DEAD/DEAH box helicase family protein [Leptospira mayottensis]
MNLNFEMDYWLTKNVNIQENLELREPQIEAYWEVYEHFIIDRKASDAIVVIPTGVGKTGLIGILPYKISKGRVLVITPRLVIKDSILGALNPNSPDNFWFTRNVFKDVRDLPIVIEYKRGVKLEYLNNSNLVILNIHRLQDHLESSLLNQVKSDHFDMIIIDEAHHSPAKTWVNTIKYFSNAKIVKLTGTPFRTDEVDISGELVYKYKLSRAMAKNFVKKLENISYVPEDLLLTIDNDESKTYNVDEIYKLGIKDEDWISRSVAYSRECSLMIVRKSIELLLQKRVNGRNIPHKIISTSCSISHAEQIKMLYESEGLRTAIVHSRQEEGERKEILNLIENHEVDVIVNVAMLGEGYDHPFLSVAAIFRPFRALLPYMQFIGRILRIIPSHYNPKTEDNIGWIVSHKHLYLDKLWEDYKQEINESAYINEINDTQEFIEETSNARELLLRDNLLGIVTEKGIGTLQIDPYLTKEIEEARIEEQKIRDEKIKKIMELGVSSYEEANRFLDQIEGQSQNIKNPVAFEEGKRQIVTTKINMLVPDILSRYGLSPKGSELKNCSRLFGDQDYSWILKKNNKNDAMLSIYIRTTMKNYFNRPISEWSLRDLNLAEERLDKIREYVDSAIKAFVTDQLG